MTLQTYVRFAWHAALLRLNPSYRVPLTMNIQLLRLCNNRCLYCGQDHRDPEQLSLPVVLNVLREARKLGGIRAHFTGGEPLLRDDIEDIVSEAKRLGFFVSLATNGSLAARRLDTLRKVDQVLLSFDGPEEIHDRLCGAGSYQAVQKAIALFKEHKIHFWTTSVLTRLNIPHIDWIVEHARQHGSFANFVVMMTHDTGIHMHPKADEVPDLLPSQDETRAAVGRLLELKRKGAPVGSSLPYLEELHEWPSYVSLWSPKPARRYKCRAWRSTCELLPDGRLYSCDWAMNHLEGIPVEEHGFAAAFRRLPLISACQSCALSCYLEANLIFSLHPPTVMNWLRCLR